MKKINFKQPKYMIPAIIYLPLLFVGYMVIDMFNLDIAERSDPNLKTTDYLSDELPQAYTDSVLGSKMQNTERSYGRISDLSAVSNVENDRDSVNKKEDYESKYSEQEAIKVRQQQEEEKRKLEEMQERVRQNRKRMPGDDYIAPVSDAEIAKVQRMRRQHKMGEVESNLSYDEDNYVADASTGSGTSRHIGSESSYSKDSSSNNFSYDLSSDNREREARDTSSRTEQVKKKTKDVSDYFNTIGVSEEQSKLITAIIDEDIKAVDGSRVRLRLLDDIEIGQKTVKKGTYLYATMSGFGKQRVNGKIESIFFNEDIMKVDLTIYDTDGLPGLYVPLSRFRETAKDVASSAMQGGNIMDNTTNSTTGIKGWASQAAQNASQRVMTALGTAAKKNRVKLKYGTRVYLIDSSKN